MIKNQVMQSTQRKEGYAATDQKVWEEVTAIFLAKQ